MISYIQGVILNKQNNYLIIKTNKIGYKVFVSQKKYDDSHRKKEIELYIYQQVGEQVLALYGLSSFDELTFFELLISVSGIGPKTALGVLDIAPIPDIQVSILNGSSDLLSQASGIGKKTAERVVLELKSKLGKLDLKLDSSSGSRTGEELDALMALGYSMLEARDALSLIDPEITESSEVIKQALKNMK